MKNSKALYQELVGRSGLQESTSEVGEVVYRILEKAYGLTQAEIRTGKGITLSPMTDKFIDSCMARIGRHEPIQYVLNEAYFYGRRYFVDESVLIPRPETEELIRLALTEIKKAGMARNSIMDIGTGSGCMAITLSLELPGAAVTATDVSEAALMVAAKNQDQLRSKVKFITHDILHENIPPREFNMIVSNPPYIAMAERSTMDSSVHAFEPGLALFVPDDDPLLYYKAIAEKSIQSLLPAGMLLVEINERFGREVGTLFEKAGLKQVRVVKDIFRKDRFVVGYESV